MIEDRYRERARADILSRIEHGSDSDWFNLRTYLELGNRTLTEAWRAGDRDAVIEVLDLWRESSEHVAQRALADPELLQELRDRSAEIAVQASHHPAA